MSMFNENYADFDKLGRIARRIMDEDGWDELFGMDRSELQERFGTNYRETQILWELVTDPKEDETHWPEVNKCKCKLCQVLSEAIHQGFDGWEDDERVTIDRFVRDLFRACNNLEDDARDREYTEDEIQEAADRWLADRFKPSDKFRSFRGGLYDRGERQRVYGYILDGDFRDLLVEEGFLREL